MLARVRVVLEGRTPMVLGRIFPLAAPSAFVVAPAGATRRLLCARAIATAVAFGSVHALAQTTPQAPAPQAPSTLTPPEPQAPATEPASATPEAPADAADAQADPRKVAPQSRPRPAGDGTVGVRVGDVYSEDWWSHTRPVVEVHGYFRTRAELYHNFFLGRHSVPAQDGANLWLPPLDYSYTDINGSPRLVVLCGDPDSLGRLNSNDNTCNSKTQSSANLRLRLNPEIHISDNLRVMAQVDLLNNLVLGSTPDAYTIKPAGSGTSGYSATTNGNGYAPIGDFSNTQGPPTAGINNLRDSLEVQRAWAEYVTPLGELRFGRMPHHWGLGMLYNAGDCIDCDYQTNIDRIMFVTGVKSADLFFGGSWDFISSGPTNASAGDIYGGQAINTANLANVDQWSAFIARRTNPDLQRLKLARSEVVVNGGIYASYRKQLLDVAYPNTPTTVDSTNVNNGLERRAAEQLAPDVWLQLLWQKLRFEAEFASIWGSVQNSPARQDLNDPLKIRQWGFATQTEFRAVEDKLRLQFGAGWASGDSNVEGLGPGANGFQPRLSEGPISTFRFHPAYMIDYIFFRKILSRIEGAYYFRPSVDYDFVRSPNGQKLGGNAAIIWSRASEFVQTPGNKRDLGVELDLQVYYQAKDGSLNDNPNKMGGFYSALQYGVFFPLGGLDYLPGVQGTLSGTTPKLPSYDLSAAQTVRLILGVMF